ncbi:hypothetical protein P154DRAFT_443768 [Amniculicola lignicola CBS 123094]|uniref:Aminoglycoside phosphotransferase domain-containing protein n=1 Tax=Amniculicola lignicola CBS 123094 TaxID=1392246 RepID=A0A6A5W3C2_9PLEO|nr:hypothetical protein P154DRAFT_443768 [Amniculicola lignicola CBS 123094]
MLPPSALLNYVDSDSEENDDDTADSMVSQTSTVKYDHESFKTIEKKVMSLILELFPGYRAKDVILEKMAGGGYNRIIGIKLSTPKFKKWMRGKAKKALSTCIGGHRWVGPDSDGDYILRVPRHQNGIYTIAYEIKTLQFISKNILDPVPKVHLYDKTFNNALNDTFMLQHRLPGKALHTIWPDLNFKQKKSATRQICQVLLSLGKVANKAPGIISPENMTLDLALSPKLRTLPIPALEYTGEPEWPKTLPSKPQSTLDFLVSHCTRHRDFEIFHSDTGLTTIWDDFISMAKKLHSMGFLSDEEQFHFCHVGFEMRNLLVEVIGDSVTITGVMDWGNAFFGPKFLSCRAPFFLWRHEDADDNDEDQALYVSQFEEHRELKTLFEDLVGPGFLHYAYEPEYILLRRMLSVIRNGAAGSWEQDAAKEIINDFEQLYPTTNNN